MEEKPFYIQVTFYDSPREDCSGFYSDIFYFDTRNECLDEYKKLEKIYEGEPTGLDSNCFISDDYDKGYNDGFADGANNFEEKLLVEAIANYLVVEGCQLTISGNRHFEFKDIAEHFHITLERLMELKDDIVEELYQKEQICDEEGVVADDDFDLMFYGNYCNVDMDEGV